MIERSFVLLERVGELTERRIWDQGILSWDEFLGADRVSPFSAQRKAGADAELEAAKEALRERRLPFFADRMHQRDLWRTYPSFRDDAAFLDIETTGLSRHNAVTVVGVARGGRFTALVRGQDLTRSSLADALDGASMIVTFNGSTFDLPMLRHHHPVPQLELPHLDLRYLAARVGRRGGLKRIERELGLGRDREFSMMTGQDAVRLWHMWEGRGNRRALDLLLRYNEADTVNLAQVAELLFLEAQERTFPL